MDTRSAERRQKDDEIRHRAETDGPFINRLPPKLRDEIIGRARQRKIEKMEERNRLWRSQYARTLHHDKIHIFAARAVRLASHFGAFCVESKEISYSRDGLIVAIRENHHLHVELDDRVVISLKVVGDHVDGLSALVEDHTQLLDFRIEDVHFELVAETARKIESLFIKEELKE